MTLENEAPTTTADLAAEQGAGPVLLLRGAAEGRLLLRALVVRPESAPEERLSADGGEVEALSLLRLDDLQVLAYDFSLPLGRAASYAFGGETYAVNTAWEGDLRIAYTSCNGQESGDRKRPLEKRNVLWQRLARQHEAAPFHVLLQGGDQIYADEVASLHRRARHNPIAAWSYRTQGDIGPLRAAMRRELFRRYHELYRQPQVAHIMARVPMLAIWDDHDICDGWGSLPPERQDSDFGRAVFAVSRELYLLFQHGAVAPDYPPAFGDRDG
ncbi:MAG TPA: alkaline phosphatase D family protein, partial [Kiloniellaceae bacterium]|nr:alkaline phosphatase D family protein [Kiloniellaceae bacterium]